MVRLNIIFAPSQNAFFAAIRIIGRDGTFESGRAIDLNTHEPTSIDGLEEYSQKAVTVTEMYKYILEHNEAVMPIEEFTGMMETLEAEIESEDIN